MSNFSGLWSLELKDSLKPWFTIRLKARTQGPEKFDHFFTLKIAFDGRPSKLSTFWPFQRVSPAAAPSGPIKNVYRRV